MNLEEHLLRQMAFSHATFGPGRRTKGVIDHIKKELVEVEKSTWGPEEWVDVVALAMDGLTRSLAYPHETYKTRHERADPVWVANQACTLIREKQGIVEGRRYPDWRTVDHDKAIEHDRSGE